MHIGNYLSLVLETEKSLIDALENVAKSHSNEPDITDNCKLISQWSQEFIGPLQTLKDQYPKEENKEGHLLKKIIFSKHRKKSLSLLSDLQGLWLVASEAEISTTALKQAADAIRNEELSALCENIIAYTQRQLSWLKTRIKAAAAQTLVAAE